MWVLLLIPACTAAALSCARLVRVASSADPLPETVLRSPGDPDEGSGLGLYETAYLAGGPHRVVDLALVLMAGRGRLHLAHTGWTTVVDPDGGSGLERALITAIGPDGQCKTAALRPSLTAHPALLEIGEQLTLAGLAVPALLRERMVLAVRQLRAALLLSVALLATALAIATPGDGSQGTAIAWFALPLVLTAGTLLMARVDVQPYTRWATPAGESLLRIARVPGPPRDAERELLTAVAVAGPSAVPDERLRAALFAQAR